MHNAGYPFVATVRLLGVRERYVEVVRVPESINVNKFKRCFYATGKLTLQKDPLDILKEML